MHPAKILCCKAAVSITGEATGQSNAATRLRADETQIRLYRQLSGSPFG